MIIRDVVELLDDLTEEQRDELLKPVLENLTQTSHYAILEFQLNWNEENGSFKDFIKGQNAVIKECIKIEMTEFGKIVRKMEGLRPLENVTEVF
jgi:hypothetical protein